MLLVSLPMNSRIQAPQLVKHHAAVQKPGTESFQVQLLYILAPTSSVNAKKGAKPPAQHGVWEGEGEGGKNQRKVRDLKPKGGHLRVHAKWTI